MSLSRSRRFIDNDGRENLNIGDSLQKFLGAGQRLGQSQGVLFLEELWYDGKSWADSLA